MAIMRRLSLNFERLDYLDSKQQPLDSKQTSPCFNNGSVKLKIRFRDGKYRLAPVTAADNAPMTTVTKAMHGFKRPGLQMDDCIVTLSS
jgi:hypothetical protein